MRRRLATGFAALGAACFALVALAPLARADAPPLTIYQAGGVGQGVIVTFAVKPSLFDPLLQGGTMYTSTSMTSQGGGVGNSLASPVFPGTFLIGGAKSQIGCGGLPGSPWVEGNYPAIGNCPNTQETRAYRSAATHFGADRGHPEADAVPNALLDRSSVEVGHSKATATSTLNRSLIQVTGYELRQDPAGAVLMHVDQMQIENAIDRTDRLVTHRARVSAQGISLLGSAITIDSLVSQARTSADGVTPDAKASLTFGDVRVAYDGKSYRATIDNDGVRITDPALEPGQRASLSEEIRDSTARAGLTISAGTPTKIVEGQQAEASEDGLTIAIGGTIPSVPVPSQVAPAFAKVLQNIPTKCLYELGVNQPLCMGAGVLPGFGSQFPLRLQIGSTNSLSIGGFYSAGTPTLGCPTCPVANPTPGTDVLGEQIPGGTGGTGGPAPAPAPGGGVPQPAAALTGLVSILPSAALAVAGALLLLLAAALALGPSLRHARAG
jgi:hypothetical protein